MADMTNEQRGARAFHALATYDDWRHFADRGPFEGEVQSALGDMLSDMRHLADAQGIEWAAVERMGSAHHAAEVGDEAPKRHHLDNPTIRYCGCDECDKERARRALGTDMMADAHCGNCHHTHAPADCPEGAE